MSNLKPCKSCNKEVSKDAKVCPHCGKKLKMGLMAKIGILIVILIIIGVAGMPSSEDIEKEIATIESTTPDNINTAKLSETFSIMSKSTDIQRDNAEEEIKGKILRVNVKVYEVNIKDKEKLIYRIQGSSTNNTPGTFVNIYARNAAEAKKIESLKTDNVISVKGKVTGVFMRNIDIDLARIVK